MEEQSAGGVAEVEAAAAGGAAPEVESIGGDAGDAGGSVESAPHDDYRAPSRDEYESLKQQAALGARYAPFAQQIDALIQRGFSPAEAKAEINAQKAEGTARTDDEFTDPEKYSAMWTKFGKSPAAFREVIHREARNAAKGDLDKLAALEKKFAALEQSHNEVRGAAVLAQHRFAPNPEFAKIEKPFLDLLQKGMPIEEARELAMLRAERAAWSKGAGASAPGALAAKKPPAKPAPREDRSAPKPGASRANAAPASAPPPKGLSRGQIAMQRAMKRVSA